MNFLSVRDNLLSLVAVIKMPFVEVETAAEYRIKHDDVQHSTPPNHAFAALKADGSVVGFSRWQLRKWY